MIEREWISDLAADLGVTPSEAKLAITLARNGRAELIAAVVAGQMTVRKALIAARETMAS
jgi:hypothetical protein